MDKTLQDLAWSCLPKEFKEEVKSKYKNAVRFNEYAHECVVLRDLFGEDNLTSDAEGEEILTCEKSKAMQLYFHLLDLVENERMSEHYSGWCDLEREYIALFGENVFADYFGFKCLPDVPSSEPRDCDNPLADKDDCRWRNDGKCAFNNACYFEPLNPQEPKPAEPKLKYSYYTYALLQLERSVKTIREALTKTSEK